MRSTFGDLRLSWNLISVNVKSGARQVGNNRVLRLICSFYFGENDLWTGMAIVVCAPKRAPLLHFGRPTSRRCDLYSGFLKRST